MKACTIVDINMARGMKMSLNVAFDFVVIDLDNRAAGENQRTFFMVSPGIMSMGTVAILHSVPRYLLSSVVSRGTVTPPRIKECEQAALNKESVLYNEHVVHLFVIRKAFLSAYRNNLRDIKRGDFPLVKLYESIPFIESIPIINPLSVSLLISLSIHIIHPQDYMDR